MKLLFTLLALISLEASAVMNTQSLDQLGFKEGIISHDVFQENTLYFPIPAQGVVKSAKLVLFIEHAPILKEPSNLKIFLGNIPVTLVDLKGSSAKSDDGFLKRTISINVPLEMFNSKFLPVQIQLTSFINSDPCADRRLVSGLIRITEKSNLEVDYYRSRLDIPNFFATLPPETSVYVHPKKVNPEQYKVLYDLASSIEKLNKKVKFTAKPEEAIIEVFSDANKKSLEVIQTGERTFLSINLNVKQDFSLFADHFGVFYPAAKNPIDTKKNNEFFKTRNELGMDAAGSNASRGKVWNATLKTKTGMEAKKLHLSITSAPREEDIPAHVFVYYNQELIKVVALNKATGAPQYFGINLPESTVYPAQLQLIANHGEKATKCGGANNSFFDIRLLPDTEVEFAPIKNSQTSFAKFAATSQAGLDIILPSTALEAPLTYLPYLLRLQSLFSLPLDAIRFTDKVDSSRNSVRFLAKDETSKNIYINSMESLQIEGLPHLSFMNVVANKSNYELQIGHFSDFIPDNFNLFNAGDEDLAVISKNYVEVLAHTSNLHERIQSYSDRNSLNQFFEEWKYYLLVFAWIALTIIFIKLAKKFK